MKDQYFQGISPKWSSYLGQEQDTNLFQIIQHNAEQTIQPEMTHEKTNFESQRDKSQIEFEVWDEDVSVGFIEWKTNS